MFCLESGNASLCDQRTFVGTRSAFTFASVDTPLRRIIVTSSVSQEGKTTISSNLAVVMAQGDKKAVLIYADLRRPQVHHGFGLSNRIDITNLFIRYSDAILVAKPDETKTNVLGLAIEQLQNVGARILGVVLSDVKPSCRKYGYYYGNNMKKSGKQPDNN